MDERNELGLRINTDYKLFQQSGEKCYFCWLGWTKQGDVHLHPENVGWVQCVHSAEGDEHV